MLRVYKLIVVFQNRQQAGELLAEKLIEYKENKDTLVLAIPRGGVVVGKAIASHLNLPLDVVIVKKLGAPGNPELAIGAVASDGTSFVDGELALRLGVDQEYLDNEVRRKIREIREREKKYKPTTYPAKPALRVLQDHPHPTIILTDDGIATGATCEVAIKFIKRQAESVKRKRRMILAVPVIAKDTYKRLKPQVDELIALEVPEFFGAVGQFYREFGQVSDEEIIRILLASRN